MIFGQLIVGPPACGKSTYCRGMSLFTQALGRSCAVVNLDFANDSLPYKADVDVRDLISLEEVMETLQLGPNGGLVYCMEFLLEHFDWLAQRLEDLKTGYVLFDSPGQVELFTHHNVVEVLLKKLTKQLDLRLTSVHLVDSFYCCEPATFVSAVTLVASSMLRLGLPHVNVLSKIDLLPRYGSLPFALNFFTEMVDLTPMARYVADPFASEGQLEEDDQLMQSETALLKMENEAVQVPCDEPHVRLHKQRYSRMVEAVCDMLSDLSLVSFLPMNVQDGETVGRVLAAVDRANGYSFVAAYAENNAAKKSYEESVSGFDGNRAFPRGSSLAEKPSMTPNQIFQMVATSVEPSHVTGLDILERYEGSLNSNTE